MNKLTKKKYITLIVAACLILVAIVGTSFAYFSDTTMAAKNNFEIGGVDTKIVEENLKYPNINGTGSKEVKVQNIGKSDCFIRVRITTSPEGVATISGGSSKWISDNGYYYYTDLVPANAGESSKTEELFTTYTMNSNYYNSGNFEPFDISVYQESIDATGYSNYQEAWNEYNTKSIIQ